MSGTDGPEGGMRDGALDTLDEGGLPGLVIDPRDRTICALNETFDQVFGWSRDELEGTDYRAIVDPDDHRSVRALLAILSFGGFPPSEPVTVLEKAGETTETRWLGIPNIVDQRGGPVAVICRPAAWPPGPFPGDPGLLDGGCGDEPSVSPEPEVDDERKGRHSRSFWD